MASRIEELQKRLTHLYKQIALGGDHATSGTLRAELEAVKAQEHRRRRETGVSKAQARIAEIDALLNGTSAVGDGDRYLN